MILLATPQILTWSNCSPIKLLLKNYRQDYIKSSNLRKEVGIAIKSKETKNQLEPVRNSYVAIMHQPVTVSSNI